MIKQLLMSAAVAAMAFSVSAEPKVLWEAPSAEGVLADWGKPVYSLTAADAAQIKAGDNIVITVASADKELSQYPQVSIIDGTNGGWPPLQNAIVNDACEVSFGITYDIATKIHENGISFNGNAAYISKVMLEEGSIEVGPYTVWFGPKQCAWGDAVSIPKEVFADVKAGDKIKVQYDKSASEHTLQILLGGWSGWNLPTYEAWKYDFFTVDEETGWITLDLVEALASYVVGEGDEATTYDAFSLLKDGGVVMQGPCLVNQVLFEPAAEEPAVNYYAVGGFQGWDVEQPAVFTFADGVYTLVAEKASTMKISTLAGNWDDFNSATIAPSGEAENGVVPFEVIQNYEFILDYEADWTVTIDPSKQTIKFATEDARPEVDIYLRGGMNDWGVDEAWKLTSTDGNIYTLANVSIEAGTEFKIADASWGTVNYGLDEAIAPDTTVTLVYNGNNCKLTQSVENATVEFNLSHKTLLISTGSGIEAISSDNASAVYYNLQGVKVANPTEGNIYIVKKGTKTSKVAF